MEDMIFSLSDTHLFFNDLEVSTVCYNELALTVFLSVSLGANINTSTGGIQSVLMLGGRHCVPN